MDDSQLKKKKKKARYRQALFFFFNIFSNMETPSNIPCSQLVDTLTALAHNTTPDNRSYNHVKTIPREHTSYLTDTAEAVRQVAKKLGKTRVKWDQAKSVMIITKPGDCSLIGMTREMAIYLIETPRYGLDCGITW